jgi:hypothetical protein
VSPNSCEMSQVNMIIHLPSAVLWLCGTQWAVAGHDDVPLMGTFRAAMLFLAVDRCAEEVSPGVYTCSIDIVVFCVIAHPDCWVCRT